MRYYFLLNDARHILTELEDEIACNRHDDVDTRRLQDAIEYARKLQNRLFMLYNRSNEDA